VATVARKLEVPDSAAVVEWRFTILLEAGFLPDQALKLATNRAVDVRLAERLLARGCPPATALRILL
jgi:hypothetical protein